MFLDIVVEEQHREPTKAEARKEAHIAFGLTYHYNGQIPEIHTRPHDHELALCASIPETYQEKFTLTHPMVVSPGPKPEKPVRTPEMTDEEYTRLQKTYLWELEEHTLAQAEYEQDLAAYDEAKEKYEQDVAIARKICDTCPLKQRCRSWSITEHSKMTGEKDSKDLFGIFGGWGEADRDLAVPIYRNLARTHRRAQAHDDKRDKANQVAQEKAEMAYAIYQQDRAEKLQQPILAGAL